MIVTNRLQHARNELRFVGVSVYERLKSDSDLSAVCRGSTKGGVQKHDICGSTKTRADKGTGHEHDEV